MITTFVKRITTIRPSQRFYNGIRVLGIESSCDDTAAAIVDDKGSILGEGHFSQSRFHVETGGVLPHVAMQLHKEHLRNVVEDSIKQSNLDYENLDAIAVTVKPGLILCLEAGLEHAKELCRLHRKSLLPIHHMEAHALTGRLVENVKFPFLVFLISGGHCILSLVESVDKFYTLGTALYGSPGRMMDRVARRAKLNNLKKFRGMAGGAAIEAAALDGDPTSISFVQKITRDQGCNLIFSGMFTRAVKYIEQKEIMENLEPDEVIPDIHDLCASFQWGMTQQLCKCLELAMYYLEKQKLLKDDEKCLVVSGGVASNEFVRKSLKFVCDHHGYNFVVPPPKLCTDNGVMIAWNGVEKLRQNIQPVQPEDLDSVTFHAKFPLGENISEDVKNVLTSISVRHLKMQKFIQSMNQY